MSVIARLGFALVFLGLGVAAAFYAAATAPEPQAPGLSLPVFAWTGAETACTRTPEACDGEALVARAASAPLSPRPFMLRLAAKINAGDGRSAPELAAQVLARDPRAAFPRLVLSEAALREAGYERFLDHFLPLFDVDRVQRDAYADVLAALSTEPAFRAALEARLAQDPVWAGAYLGALTSRGGLAVSDLIPLYRQVPAAQAGLLRRLTRDGQWDMAYVAFADFVAAGTGESALALSAPFNPRLLDSAAPAPFNWARVSRSAQLLAEGGAYVFYEGRRPETLLVQSFPLSPGSYTLGVEQSGEATESGGFFRWQITCATGGPALVQFDVRSLKAAAESGAWDFDLAPGSCSYLTLSLSGVPGSFPRPGRIEVKAVRLQKREAEGSAP